MVIGLIPFGKVLKIHGIKGEIKILPFNRESNNLNKLERIFLQKKRDDKPTEYRIIQTKSQNKLAILELEGINSIDDAEKLIHSNILVEKSDLIEPQDDEYYWFQLIGLDVYTKDGKYLGKVDNLMDRHSQNLLIVKNGKREFLIPMVDAIVDEIILEDSKIIITPIEGLLD